MTLSEICERARAAAASGVPVRIRGFGLYADVHDGKWKPDKACCGLGLALIGLPADNNHIRTLGINEAQFWSFADGFDGKPLGTSDKKTNARWWRAGRDLARELLGEGE